MKKLFLCFAVASFGYVTSVEAKTLYVCGAGGNDATTYAANGPDSQWATIGRAAWGSTNRSAPNASQAAAAGDVVRICAGTYSTAGSGLRYEPAYQPANSGSAGNPITFEANGQVVLTLNSSRGPVIGASGRSYIIWRGFSINETQAPSTADTGMVAWFGPSVGGGLENTTLVCNPATLPDDNHPGLRLEGIDGMLIRSNRISGCKNNGGGTNSNINGNGIQTYRTRNTIIEHNEISGTGVGIHLKSNDRGTNFDEDGNNIVRYNLIYGVDLAGIHLGQNPFGPDEPTRIYQNIVRDSGAGVAFQELSANRYNTNVYVVNNTFVNNRNGLVFYYPTAPAARRVFWNNIIVGGTSAIISLGTPTEHQDHSKNDFEHNVYYAQTSFVAELDAEGANRARMSLAQWMSAPYGQDASGPAATTANPLFVSSSDLRLQGGSPAQSIGRAIAGIGGGNGATIPAGAYITGGETIGRTSGAASTTLPDQPRNLRITP